MLGRDHALSGAAAFAAVAPLLHAAPVTLAAGTVLTAGAALLPDIDEPGSTIARQGGFLTTGLAWAVHRVSGGHRKGTHSFLGVAVFAALAWAAVTFSRSIWAGVLLGLFLALLLAAVPHALHIGGHHGDLLALLAAGAAVYWHLGLSLVLPCIILGVLDHIAGDELTHSGCPVWYPFSRTDHHLLPHGLRFTTGKFAENWIVTPLLLAGLALLLVHDTGGIR